MNSTKENNISQKPEEKSDNKKNEILNSNMERANSIKPSIATLQDKRIPFACVVTQLMSQNLPNPGLQRYFLISYSLILYPYRTINNLHLMNHDS